MLQNNENAYHLGLLTVLCLNPDSVISQLKSFALITFIIYRPPTHPATNQPTDHVPTTYRPPTNHLPTTYQPPTTTYQPPTNHLPATYTFSQCSMLSISQLCVSKFPLILFTGQRLQNKSRTNPVKVGSMKMKQSTSTCSILTLFFPVLIFQMKPKGVTIQSCQGVLSNGRVH